MKDRSFKRKLRRARQVEITILNWIRENFDKKAKLITGYFPKYDIKSEVLGNVEVKEDRMAHQTQNYAIEFEYRNGRPSGIAVCTAQHFVLVDWDYVIFTTTENLRFIIENCKEKKIVKMGWKDEKERQGKGWLVPRIVILSSPLVRVLERWFPILEYD